MQPGLPGGLLRWPGFCALAAGLQPAYVCMCVCVCVCIYIYIYIFFFFFFSAFCRSRSHLPAVRGLLSLPSENDCEAPANPGRCRQLAADARGLAALRLRLTSSTVVLRAWVLLHACLCVPCRFLFFFSFFFFSLFFFLSFLSIPFSLSFSFFRSFLPLLFLSFLPSFFPPFLLSFYLSPPLPPPLCWLLSYSLFFTSSLISFY